MIYSSWTVARAGGTCVYVKGEEDLSVSGHWVTFCTTR
jgi:hypothetical protein